MMVLIMEYFLKFRHSEERMSLHPSSSLLNALDLHDFNCMLSRHFSCYAPKWQAVLTNIGKTATDVKDITYRYSLEYDNLLYSLWKELNSSLPLDEEDFKKLFKCMFLSQSMISNLKNCVFNDYFYRAKKILEFSKISEADETICKLLKVFRVLNSHPELSKTEMHQYEFMAILLGRCFHENVQNGPLVIELLKQTIKMTAKVYSASRYVIHPTYHEHFHCYLLALAVKEKFDLQEYCSKHPATLWEYSRAFSLPNAVCLGKYQRVLCLLQHGFDVFDRRTKGLSLLEESRPLSHLLVLYMMFKMRSMISTLRHCVHLPENGLHAIKKDQERCFNLIWITLPDPYVTQTELTNTGHSCLISKYGKCFSSMASGPKEPRSLKHLARCKIRDNLRPSWNLPDGIFQLGLPKHLEEYLSLERN